MRGMGRSSAVLLCAMACDSNPDARACPGPYPPQSANILRSPGMIHVW